MKRTRKDHSGTPKNRLPSIPKLDLNLYHWSPASNRARILHDGLTPGRKSLQGDWKPPYICFSDDPELAWVLSGRLWPEIKEWDLWMCHVDNQTSFEHYELITDTYPDTGRMFVKEYRVYDRIYKRDLIYIGSKNGD